MDKMHWQSIHLAKYTFITIRSPIVDIITTNPSWVIIWTQHHLCIALYRPLPLNYPHKWFAFQFLSTAFLVEFVDAGCLGVIAVVGGGLIVVGMRNVVVVVAAAVVAVEVSASFSIGIVAVVVAGEATVTSSHLTRNFIMSAYKRINASHAIKKHANHQATNYIHSLPEARNNTVLVSRWMLGRCGRHYHYRWITKSSKIKSKERLTIDDWRWGTS